MKRDFNLAFVVKFIIFALQLEKKEVLIPDGDTSRRLALTTEDLRFSEFLLSSVADYRKESGIGEAIRETFAFLVCFF